MTRGLSLLLLLSMLAPCTFAVRSSKKKARKPAASAVRSKPKAAAGPATAPPQSAVVVRQRTGKKSRRGLPVFDPTAGDNVDGDELEVRRAAVDALGPYDGTVVVVDPQTGRILTTVNQKTAF